MARRSGGSPDDAGSASGRPRGRAAVAVGARRGGRAAARRRRSGGAVGARADSATTASRLTQQRGSSHSHDERRRQNVHGATDGTHPTGSSVVNNNTQLARPHCIEKLSGIHGFARTIARHETDYRQLHWLALLLAGRGREPGQRDRGRLRPQVRPRLRASAIRPACRPSSGSRRPTRSTSALGFWGSGVNAPLHRQQRRARTAATSAHGTFNVDYLWQSNIVRGTAQLDWHIGGGGRIVWSAAATTTLRPGARACRRAST